MFSSRRARFNLTWNTAETPKGTFSSIECHRNMRATMALVEIKCPPISKLKQNKFITCDKTVRTCLLHHIHSGFLYIRIRATTRLSSVHQLEYYIEGEL